METILYHDTRNSFNMMMEYLKTMGEFGHTIAKFKEAKSERYQWILDEEIKNKFYKYVI